MTNFKHIFKLAFIFKRPFYARMSAVDIILNILSKHITHVILHHRFCNLHHHKSVFIIQVKIRHSKTIRSNLITSIETEIVDYILIWFLQILSLSLSNLSSCASESGRIRANKLQFHNLWEIKIFLFWQEVVFQRYNRMIVTHFIQTKWCYIGCM